MRVTSVCLVLRKNAIGMSDVGLDSAWQAPMTRLKDLRADGLFNAMPRGLTGEELCG